MKLFKFGSCRINYLNNQQDIYNQIYYTHTTKEILQIIDFFNGLQNNSVYVKAFPNNFRTLVSRKKKEFKKADAVLIEISSLKILKDSRGFFYNSVHLGKAYKNHNIKFVKQTYDDLINDIFLIKKRINKKIIFQGHINLDFENIGHIKDREIIDQAIMDSHDNYVIYKNVFDKKDIRELLKDKSDLCHLSQYGLDKLKSFFHNNSITFS